MNQRFLSIIIILALSFSCKNSVNISKSNILMPDITGVYRLPETSCDIVITFLKDGDDYQYYIKGNHIDVQGKAKVSCSDSTYYVTFDGPTSGNNKPGSLSGQYEENKLLIQNYGNSQNEYSFFDECPYKYLEFVKQQ